MTTEKIYEAFTCRFSDAGEIRARIKWVASKLGMKSGYVAKQALEEYLNKMEKKLKK